MVHLLDLQEPEARVFCDDGCWYNGKASSIKFYGKAMFQEFPNACDAKGDSFFRSYGEMEAEECAQLCVDHDSCTAYETFSGVQKGCKLHYTPVVGNSTNGRWAAQCYVKQEVDVNGWCPPVVAAVDQGTPDLGKLLFD